MSAYKGMFEASVLTVDDNGESVMPYFDRNTLDSYIENYFEVNLKKYTNDYELSINYMASEITSVNDKVSITLTADINYFYKFEKTKLFYIASRDTV